MQDDCRYCLKESDHGGNCKGKYDGRPCIFWERDPRGCIGWKNVAYSVSFERDLSTLNEWHTVVCRGVEKTVRVDKIDSLEWDKNRRGLQGIILHCRIDYFTEENGEWPTRPNLRVVK